MKAGEREVLGWPLFVALAIHAFGALTLRASSSSEARPVNRARASELDVALESPLESSPPPAFASLDEGARTGIRARERRVSSKAGAIEAEAPSEFPQPLEPTSPVEPGPPAPAPLGPERLGIGGQNPLIVRPETSGEAPTRAPSAAPGVERSIANELARSDARLGYGPQGPILGELERLTQSATMPDNTSALFVAAIDGSGRLTELSVLEATASFGSWQLVAEKAKRSLRKKKLAVPSGTRGMKLRIAVSSRIQLPSGADPGLELRLLGIPLKRGAGKRSSRGGSGKTLKLPSATIAIVPFSGIGDLADIGAKPRRLVHAHVVDQDVL
jgi:hypothetical protein